MTSLPATPRARRCGLSTRPTARAPIRKTHLAKFEGVLQADAYAGFNALFEDGQIRDAVCWTHARRKFHDLHAVRAAPLTTEALHRAAELNVIEAEIRGQPPDGRRQVRQLRWHRLFDELERWLRTALEPARRKADKAAASLYALKLCQRCCASPTTTSSRLTTLRPNAPCLVSPSVGAILCSPAPAPAAAVNGPPRLTR